MLINRIIFLTFLDIAMDWSDHALWWPEKNRWLARSRSTLDQYGVQADAKLHFTPMHKNLHVQLPDLQTLDLRVNFCGNVFAAVVHLCKELGMYVYRVCLNLEAPSRIVAVNMLKLLYLS